MSTPQPRALQGQKGLVTGATTGLGRVIAMRLARDGAEVVVHGRKQPDDPAALGEALVQIADMEHPPKVFAAGSDALDAITPAVEARLADLRAHARLSKAAGGSFVTR
jgi:NAD(P)-dependent dehydrogenase (short-subunit alcohol dehydrogenase family)